jgi:glycine cleavage system T protein
MPDPILNALADFHLSQGATLTEYHGALVPARYRDSKAEYAAARNAAGIFDFSFRVRFAARGPDRVGFLHNMLSNDVKSLGPGQGMYATLLDVKGHILSDLRVYSEPDQILLETDADLIEKTVNALERYIIMDEVTLERLNWCGLAVQGPRSHALLESTLGGAPPSLPEFGHFRSGLSGLPLHVVRLSSTGEEGYELWAPWEDAGKTTAMWQTLLARAAGLGAVPCGTEALEMLRIEAGIPRYGADFGEDTLPLEAGLLNALSFTKGCYPGQEIVERARSRGHVNWKLVGVAVDGLVPPSVGEKLMAEGKEVGEVTSACFSPSLNRPIALAYVRREVSGLGARLTLASGPAAGICELPFYRRPPEEPEAGNEPKQFQG